MDTCASLVYVPTMGSDTSRIRQRLRATVDEIAQQLLLFLEERGPLIRGTFGTRARVCGNPGCRCARGELHESKYLTASDDGQARQVHVPAADEVHVAEAVERYRQFRRARTRLAKKLSEIRRKQLELIDALGNSLLEPYPPDNPLPPPKRRGRPPKAGDASEG
jgi:hypothetical protein